jgi:DNA-binding PadR family transcriptional regulator
MYAIVQIMSNLLNFPTKAGKQRGILSIYILHSLKKKPKSGYELLVEIREKTEGTWIPSKGTIYPLLKQLEAEGLVQIKSVDKRAKNVFEITSEGKKALSHIKKQGQQMEKKFMQFRKIISEIVSHDNIEMTNLIFDIRKTSFSSISKENKEEIIKILKRCLSDLKKVTMSKSSSSGGD